MRYSFAIFLTTGDMIETHEGPFWPLLYQLLHADFESRVIFHMMLLLTELFELRIQTSTLYII